MPLCYCIFPKSGESPKLLSAFPSLRCYLVNELQTIRRARLLAEGLQHPKWWVMVGLSFFFHVNTHPLQNISLPIFCFFAFLSLVFTAILSVKSIMAQCFQAGAPPKCRPTLEVAPLGLSQGKLQVVSPYSLINQLHKLRWTLFLPSARLKQQKHTKTLSGGKGHEGGPTCKVSHDLKFAKQFSSEHLLKVTKYGSDQNLELDHFQTCQEYGLRFFRRLSSKHWKPCFKL